MSGACFPFRPWAMAPGILALALASGCTAPRVLWSQRVVLNGRTIVFTRIDSLREGPEGHRIEYRDGDFLITGRGTITVNGFEISAEDGKAILANHPIELKPGEEVHFSSDMAWEVLPGKGAAPEAPPAPEKPAGEPEPPKPQ